MPLQAQADQDLVFIVASSQNPSAKVDQDAAFIIAQRLVPATIFTFANQDLVFLVAQRVVAFVQITGQFQDITGQPIANGYLEVKLSANAQASVGGNQLTLQTMRFPLDNNGNILNMCLWANNTISPANTFYKVQGFTSAGLQFWKTPYKQMVIPKGPGVQSISDVLTD
jgi:hypothetical protein